MNDRQAGVELDGAFIAATPVPFDAAGRYVQSAHERYVEYLAASSVDGVAVWAHTGRGLFIDDDVSTDVLRSWRAAFRGRIVVAGAGPRTVDAARLSSACADDAAWVRLAAERAERAAAGGADAILCFPPVRFRERPERRRWIRDYHVALARAGVPLIAFFLYDAAGGISYTSDELRDVLSLEGVRGIKMATLDSVCTFQEVAELVAREFPGTTLLSGEDRFLGYTLLRGASACLVGLGAACPDVQKALLRATRDRDGARTIELLLAVDRFAERTFTRPLEGYIRRMLWALVCLDVLPASAAHDPCFPELPSHEKDAVRSIIDEMRERGFAP